MNVGNAFTAISPLVAGSIVFLGIILCRWALHGRRVNDHPICRHCGYDLFGLASDSNICSECGALLTRKRAVRRGERRMHRLFFSLGLLLFFVSGGALVDQTVFFIRTADPWQYKPAWMLEHEADKSNPQVADHALSELLRRAQNGKLSSGTAASVAEHGLAVQQDVSRQWSPLRGDLLETLHSHGLLSQSQWGRYSQNTARYWLKVRPRVRRGDVIPVEVEYDTPRQSTDGPLTYAMENLDFEIAGRRARVPSWTENSSCFGLSEEISHADAWDLQLSPQDWKDIPTGRQTIVLKYTLTSFPNSHGVEDPKAHWSRKFLKSPPISTVQAQLSATLEILNENESSNPMIYDPVREAEMVNALRPIEIIAGGPNQDRFDKERFDLVIQPHTVPISVAFNVYLEADNKKWPGLGELTHGGNEDYFHPPMYYNESFGARHFNRVDVVLEPAAWQLAVYFECWPIWGHEIRYKDVPIRWPDAVRDNGVPTTQPH